MSRIITYCSYLKHKSLFLMSVSLLVAPSLQADPYWGSFQVDDCTHSFPGKRQYSSVLHGIPSGESWEEACANMPATINGQSFEKPDRCVNTGFNMWGEFDLIDESCDANWDTEGLTHKDDGCVSEGDYAGLHKYSSRLWNIYGISWEDACAQMPMVLSGKTYAAPHECVNTGGVTGMWGEWYIPDSACQSQPLGYARGAEDELKQKVRLPGYVDLHTHVMAHLGFGGVIFHGEPYGSPETALAMCVSGDDEPHSGGHSRVEAILQDDILGGALNMASHDPSGYTEFPYWPRYNTFTHQAMYYEWIKRAYEGGMRTMVALAVNGDFMFGATDNGLPDIIKGVAIATDPVLDLDDMKTLKRQTEAVYAMQNWIDSRNGGDGWFRIVTTPEEARSVIESGKLAVILGTEVDYPLGCEPGACTKEQIDTGIQEIYDMGIRFAFPIHLKTNDFGGAALYNLIAGGDSYDCKHFSHDCNVQGLTENGQYIMKGLMKKGMIIDLGHMSSRAMNDAISIAEQETYPGIVTGHTGLYDMSHLENRHEANPSGEDLKRILDIGGMVGLIPGQGNLNQVGEWREANGEYIPHACGFTSQTLLQSYLYLKNLAGDVAYDGAITFGTDFNGFAKMPGPRFGDEACPGGQSKIIQPASSMVSYPFSPDPSIIPAYGSSSVASFDRYEFGARTFDYNYDGAAHIGLMPDLFEDMRQQGLKRSDLEPVYRSADYFAEMWQKAILKGSSIK